MVRYILLFIAAFLAPAPGRAQEVKTSHGGYVIETWNSESRFDPFSIYTIAQTPDGYLWLATDGGLVRFDGLDFTDFNADNTPSLTTDDLTAMTVAPDGTLWIGAWNGSLWRLKGQKLRPFRLSPDSMGTSQVNAFCATRDGNFWFGDRWGLSRIVGDSIAPVRLPASVGTELFAIAEGSDSTLWFSAGGHLARLVGKDSSVVQAGLPPNLTATALLSGEDGELIIGTTSGLFTLRAGAFKPIDGFADIWIHVLCRDRSGAVWIGTAEDGVFRYSGGTLDHFTMEDGLPSNRVRAIFEDREGTLWFGTRGGGFFRLKAPLVQTYHPGPGVRGERISTVYQAGDGSTILGTRDSGLAIIRPGSIRTLNRRSGLPSGFIRSTFLDSRGTLWIGTTQGTVRLEARGGNPLSGVPVPVMMDGVDVPNVRSFVEDHRGNLWLGSHGYGVFRYDRAAGRISGSFKLKEYYSSLVDVIYRRKNGDIVVGSKGAMYTVADSGAVDHPSWRQAGISEVFALYEDSDSVLWVGTYGQGLFRIDGGRITRYTVEDGLFNNVVYAIVEDGWGRLWMSCNKGIFYATRRDLGARAAGEKGDIRCISFGVRDGMASAECNGGSQPSAWKDTLGRLMFATMNGVAVIDPARPAPDTAAPPVVFEELLVDGNPVPFAGAIELPPDTKRIEFDFTAIAYRRASDIEFQAYLEGFDDRWVDRGRGRSIRYTSLPGGRYEMRLRARHPDGPWPDRWSTFAFTIRPFFWERWPVRIGAIFLLAAAVVGAVRLRERKIKADARRKLEVQSTISELESRALRSQINPHFIFNSLNGIREAVLDNRTKVASEYLEKFSSLMRNVLANSDRHAITLDREIETLRLYVELEQLRFEQPFRYVLGVEDSLDATSVMIPPMLVQPIVENAIWHGLSPKEGDRLLAITFSGDRDYVRCTVEDNGVGRKRAARPGAHRRPDASRGMQITRDLIEAFRTTAGADAGVEVHDLLGADGAAAGTRVVLTIPIQPC